MQRPACLRLLRWSAGLALALAPALALADPAVAVNTNNELVTFDTSAPSTQIRKVAITGLQAGENILGIDVRPSNGKLYALGSTSRLYVIDRATGVATQVGSGSFTTPLSGTDFGFDFNPVADLIRVVSDTDQNLRINPDTAAIVGPDTTLAYVVADVNVLTNPNVVALGYDQNVPGTATTTAYGIDSGVDALVRLGDVNGTPTGPNSGQLHTIGGLGTTANGLTNLDITPTAAYASITAASGTSSSLYTVNLATGAATLVAPIAGGAAVRGLAIVPTRFFAVTTDNFLLSFAASAPGVTSTPVAITGLQAGENILAIDTRASDGKIYAIGSTGRLYRINETTGAATQVGSTFSVALSGTSFGFDIDPVSDVGRVVSDADQNFRVNLDTGVVIDADVVTAGTQTDTGLGFVAADVNAAANANVVGLAYDANLPGATTTTLFGIDSNLDVLVRLGSVAGSPNSPSTGQISTIGALGFNTSGDTAFDVTGTTNVAYAALTAPAGTSTGLYTVNLTTGAATLVGTIGGGKVVRSMTSVAIFPATTGTTPAPTGTDLVALTAGNTLLKFNSATPTTTSAPIAITGLQAGENIVAIDVRPSTGVLYGLSSQSRLYAINRTTGAATMIGTGPFAPALTGTEFGFDFDPRTGLVRVTSDADMNLRLDPVTGLVVDSDAGTAGTQTDAPLAYALADAHTGANPSVIGVAYDRIATGAATTAFGVDSTLDTLVRIGSADGTPNSANSGILTTVGNLGTDLTATAGLDIAGNGTAFLGGVVVGGQSRLYSVNLTTGVATLVGDIGTGATVRGLSAAPTADLGGGGPTTCELAVKHATINISFCGSGKDFISMDGTITAPTGSLEGKVVTVDVGGFSKSFTLNSRGRAVSGDDTFQLVGRAKNGVIKFVLKIRKEDISDELASSGLTGEATVVRAEHQVAVVITVDGVVCSQTVTVLFTAAAEHRGIAKKKP
jgi:hypothetical protein